MDLPLGRVLAIAAALGTLGAAEGVVAQGVGSLLGTVRDLETGRAVVGASVALEGTRIAATTDGSGRFQLLNVPPGMCVLRISGPGYATLVEQIPVSAGEMSVAQFHLPMLAVMIEQLVVTGQRAEARAQPGRAEHLPAATLADVIERLAPGVEVIRGSGQVGAGTRVRLRGPSGLDPQPPLVIVDGMRVEYASNSLEPSPAGPSVLDLLDPSMIESVEVLRGADASVYGLGAKNGVIVITTKRGPS
jgi:TonB-dependent SusC/RagA subfamily outer membrane receptor